MAIAATTTIAEAGLNVTTNYHSVVISGARASIRIATYNIHRCRGLDGRTRPDRVAEVIRAIDADVVALQEVVGAGPRGGGHAEEIGAALGMGWVMAPARQLRGHQFGNAVLSRWPITAHIEHDLSWKTCEPRRMQRVDITLGAQTLHIYNVHLGTAILERRHQAERLAAIVCDRHVTGPKLVLGDFNEWMRGLVTRTLSERLNSVDLRNHLKRQRTYPGVFPVLHLDHIYYTGRLEVAHIELPRSRLALVASDHLPLVADVRVG
ncbi:MAG TPA: endonuclease/exonuclease/phosphatase family protein [Vicinamibacterales bacterium]|jgi:endonuclease/exonuclease/phosphatase family metal-dependent hydrolase